MKKIKITKQDKNIFKNWGYSNKDVKQIKHLRYSVTNYIEYISFEKACEILDRKYILGAIGRAAFHSSGNINGTEWSVRSNLVRIK